MPDYARGKIYKITSGDLTYIGSTCEPTLAKRLASHVTDFKRWKDGKRKNITSFQLIETGNYEITLIELCPCGSKDELTARERFWIETTPCVNKIIPGKTRKEYRETHKDYFREYQKKYNEDHREYVYERQKKYNEDHKEKLGEYHKKYNEDHVEYHKEQCKAYYQANKDKINQARKSKRAEKSLTIII